jgi:hypothetical protein
MERIKEGHARCAGCGLGRSRVKQASFIGPGPADES